jgi:hypothetical protein
VSRKVSTRTSVLNLRLRCTLRPVSGLSVYDGAGLYMPRHLLLALLQKIFTPNVLTSTRLAALAEFYCLGPIGDTVDYVR